MQVTLTRSNPLVIQLKGTLSAANVLELQQQLAMGVNSDAHTSVFIDLKQVELIDSAALMILVSAHNQAKQQNKRVVLCSMPRSVQMIFELTQLDKVFEIWSSDAALAA
jgi:anti-anti-sigma factor